MRKEDNDKVDRYRVEKDSLLNNRSGKMEYIGSWYYWLKVVINSGIMEIIVTNPNAVGREENESGF